MELLMVQNIMEMVHWMTTLQEIWNYQPMKSSIMWILRQVEHLYMHLEEILTVCRSKYSILKYWIGQCGVGTKEDVLTPTLIEDFEGIIIHDVNYCATDIYELGHEIYGLSYYLALHY